MFVRTYMPGNTCVALTTSCVTWILPLSWSALRHIAEVCGTLIRPCSGFKSYLTHKRHYIEIFVVHIFTVAELSAKLQNFAPCKNFTLYSIEQRIYAILSMLYVYRIQSTGGAFDPPTQVTTNLSIDPWPTKVFVTVLKMLEKKILSMFVRTNTYFTNSEYCV